MILVQRNVSMILVQKRSVRMNNVKPININTAFFFLHLFLFFISVIHTLYPWFPKGYIRH
jgi:hypothetical protein